MLERCLELAAPALRRTHATSGPTGPGDRQSPDRRANAVHVDATLGLGGHAGAILAANPAVTLVGLDRDPQALDLAGQRLASYADRTHLVHAVYDQLPEVLAGLGITTVDSVLFDLGVSSLQFDQATRGFAYSQDAPLDMRMDPTQGITAAEVVNTYAADALVRILREFGEERFAPRIVASILRQRRIAPITSTVALSDLVRDAIPQAARRVGGHPAKRTFQALRIEVNRELDALAAALPAALDALAIGGRMVVLSYHSLEDRLVKRAFAHRAHSSAPVELPVEPVGSGPTLRLLTRGAETPDESELQTNPRSSSVRLRAVERINPDAAGHRAPAMHQPRPRRQGGGQRTAGEGR
jgi:16S rRNA (cytosine1402-N4)-methyltransferase